MHHLYSRAASYMDAWLAGVLEALDRRGILEDTLVIVTSDHGENFGEGGLIAHGFSLDERLIAVPLVMAGPGAVPRERVFSLAELPALIAGAAGLERHPWAATDLPQGAAIAQYEPMGPSMDARIRDFAAKWDLDERGIKRLTTGFDCATDGVHKLVVSEGVESRYDLRADPGERAPLGPGEAGGAFAALAAALEHPAVTAVPNPTPPPASEPAPPAATEAEVAAIERQLKLLGYM
jgi:arylsulfatase A-like enzyme